MAEYKTRTLIIGTGLSGLMMGKILKNDFLILEAKPFVSQRIPVSYFLHGVIPWLSTPMRQVYVHTNCWDGQEFKLQPTIGDMNDYSKKIAGKLVSRPFKEFQTNVQNLYLPESGDPSDLLKDLYQETADKIICNAKVISIDKDQKRLIAGGNQFEYGRLISTIPLPEFLNLLDINFQADFSTRPIYVSMYQTEGHTAMDVCQLIYITSPNCTPYRAHLVGSTILFDGMKELDQQENHRLIAQFWGIGNAVHIEDRRIFPGKFHPLEHRLRTALMGVLTNKYDIYCLGRFATWTHKVTWDVAKDAESILNIIKVKESLDEFKIPGIL